MPYYKLTFAYIRTYTGITYTGITYTGITYTGIQMH